MAMPDRDRKPFHLRRCNGCDVGRLVRGRTPQVRSGQSMFPVDLQGRELRYSCACVDDPIERFEDWEPVPAGADERGQVLVRKAI